MNIRWPRIIPQVSWLVAVSFLWVGPLLAAPKSDQRVAVAARDQEWQKSVELVRRGDFEAASGVAQSIGDANPLSDKLRTWLKEYQSKQQARAEMDRAEFELYVGYAQARIARDELTMALDWTWRAADVAADREVFLRSDWVQKLVNDSLAKAQEARNKHDWREAWEYYYRLVAIFDREPLYEKLEREVVTHLRLETMFKPGGKWQERLDRIRWDDAEEALKHLEALYVEPVDFRKVAERGLEALLLLAESKSVQESVEGLKDEQDRADFENRIRERLDQIRSAANIDRETCAQHFRRVVRDTNKQTVNLPESLIVAELMRGAFDPLDDFTTIIWPKEIEEFDKHTRGNFIGVGIQIAKNRSDEIEVQTPLDGTPAYRAGIQAGDIIVAVDGSKIPNDWSINKVVETITGPKGTPVTLTIRRENKELDFPLVRDEVKIQSVKGVKRDPEREENWNFWLDKENGIAYVRVTNFQKNSVEDVDNALRDLQPQGLKGIVLDLRGNPGGLLDSAWLMSSLFLKRGEEVVSTKGRIADENHRFTAPTDGPYSNYPLVVLVDANSASASEIVSGAIRDNNRGLVIGDRTFGKFSVQNLIPLGHSRAKLKMTTASYYLPSGVSLHKKSNSLAWGVEPNISIRLRRWEQFNLWQMRRDADHLGPPKAKPADKSDDDFEDLDEESKAPAGSLGPEPEPKLPALKQPDENKRPKEDPQLDTALLVLRATLLDGSRSSVAAVEPPPTGSARP